MAALTEARAAAVRGDYPASIDLFEQLLELCPQNAVELLAEVDDLYRTMPNKDNRYCLYVSRFYDFKIQPGDRVLDIGSGHDPFPLATDLADKAITDDHYGRAGKPIKQIAGKPLYECSVEAMPFRDKEFDFIYCSHVLEHSTDPAAACHELMRVGKRGYIETPIRSKDLWLNTAKVSNHLWNVEQRGNKLIFTEYTEVERYGIGCDLLMDMHCNPQTPREKAFAALILMKSQAMNTMLYWEDIFDVEVKRLSGS